MVLNLRNCLQKLYRNFVDCSDFSRSEFCIFGIPAVLIAAARFMAVEILSGTCNPANPCMRAYTVDSFSYFYHGVGNLKTVEASGSYINLH